jgi:hypothetical protein
MAARRLIAILLVLLFLSSLAAALAPVQEGVKNGTSTESTSTTAESATLPEDGATDEGRLIAQSVDASGLRPAVVRARAGDRLELRVTSHRSGTVELEGLGPAEDVGPHQPAYFDVFLRDDGSFPVRFIDTGIEIARIEVAPARAVSSIR